VQNVDYGRFGTTVATGGNRVAELMAQGMSREEAVKTQRQESRQSGSDLLRGLREGDVIEDVHGIRYRFNDGYLSAIDSSGRSSATVYRIFKPGSVDYQEVFVAKGEVCDIAGISRLVSADGRDSAGTEHLRREPGAAERPAPEQAIPDRAQVNPDASHENVAAAVVAAGEEALGLHPQTTEAPKSRRMSKQRRETAAEAARAAGTAAASNPAAQLAEAAVGELSSLISPPWWKEKRDRKWTILTSRVR